MIALCLASPEGVVGKTALCLGIARKLQADGKKVGYFRPVSVRRDGESDKDASRDCDFAGEVLELGLPSSALCPVVLDQKDVASSGEAGARIAARASEAYREASAGRDVMVVEGIARIGAKAPGAALLEALHGAVPCKLLAVFNYRTTPIRSELDGMSPGLRSMLIGVALNGIPSNKMAETGKIANGLNVPVFGVVPQDRLLMGLTVREVVDALSAKEVTPGQASDELVENIMAGAWVLDHGPLYYGRKSNKAVVVRGERPDMQLAALETPTRVLVLTGGVGPIYQVTKQARRRNVPIAVTEYDTPAALSRLTEAVQAARFAQQRKLARMDELLAQNFDFKSLYKALGL